MERIEVSRRYHPRILKSPKSFARVVRSAWAVVRLGSCRRRSLHHQKPQKDLPIIVSINNSGSNHPGLLKGWFLVGDQLTVVIPTERAGCQTAVGFSVGQLDFEDALTRERAGSELARKGDESAIGHSHYYSPFPVMRRGWTMERLSVTSRSFDRMAPDLQSRRSHAFAGDLTFTRSTEQRSAHIFPSGLSIHRISFSIGSPYRNRTEHAGSTGKGGSSAGRLTLGL